MVSQNVAAVLSRSKQTIPVISFDSSLLVVRYLRDIGNLALGNDSRTKAMKRACEQKHSQC